MIPSLTVSKHCRYRPEEVLTNQILAFFDRNPDEELTTDDAAIKFERRLPKVREVMKGLVDRGQLDRYGVRTRGNQVTYFYRRAA